MEIFNFSKFHYPSGIERTNHKSYEISLNWVGGGGKETIHLVMTQVERDVLFVIQDKKSECHTLNRIRHVRHHIPYRPMILPTQHSLAAIGVFFRFVISKDCEWFSYLPHIQLECKKFVNFSLLSTLTLSLNTTLNGLKLSCLWFL